MTDDDDEFARDARRLMANIEARAERDETGAPNWLAKYRKKPRPQKLFTPPERMNRNLDTTRGLKADAPGYAQRVAALERTRARTQFGNVAAHCGKEGCRQPRMRGADFCRHHIPRKHPVMQSRMRTRIILGLRRTTPAKQAWNAVRFRAIRNEIPKDLWDQPLFRSVYLFASGPNPGTWRDRQPEGSVSMAEYRDYTTRLGVARVLAFSMMAAWEMIPLDGSHEMTEGDRARVWVELAAKAKAWDF